MLQQLTMEQFLELTKKSPRVVVSKEIYGDRLTPVSVFENLAEGKTDAVLLDSSDHASAEDACIYMGFDPVAEFTSLGKEIRVRNGEINTYQGNAFDELRKFYHDHKCGSIKSLAKFAGGMIGFISYDAIRLIERIPDRHHNADNIPDICFKFYGTHVVFDKRTGKVTIAKIVTVKNDPQACYMQAMGEIDQLISHLLLNNSLKQNDFDSSLKTIEAKIEVDLDDQAFGDIIAKAKKYITQGDAFQIVASRRFKKSYTGNDFDIYRALRLLNPSPYQFYIRHPDFTMVGSSPEKLVSLQQGVVEVTPIAGTRQRGINLEEDQALETELLDDDKERAEHMMLVDLGRNDVGSICEPGSVDVVELAKIHRFSRVMHIVSRIQGRLRHDYDAIDAIKATFPAGTLSGAPKIRAMEIIDEIERSRRGVYGGGICSIDNEGQMDSCITIRTAFIKNGVAHVRAGAGVVIDSDPQKEADETRRKAQAVLDALALAERGFI